jgi:CBS domain-containing protein
MCGNDQQPESRAPEGRCASRIYHLEAGRNERGAPMSDIPVDARVALAAHRPMAAAGALATLRSMLSSGFTRLGSQAASLAADEAGTVPRPNGSAERVLVPPRSVNGSSRHVRQSSSPMKVADVMTARVVLVPPDATVQEAATMMAEHDIGAILVGSGEALVGVLTDRDVILRVVVDGRDPKTVRVAEVMSTNVFGCRAEDSLDEAFREMSERQVRRLPVLAEDGRVVGIVVMSDLATRGDRGRALDELRAISEPHRRAAAVDAVSEPKAQAEQAPHAE